MQTRGIGVAWACLCVALVPGASASAFPRGDEFLIVERPARLLVLNGYQQGLAPQDSLNPFVPMRILKDRDMLGDGFTPCMSVEIYGRPYYLVRGKDGLLAGVGQAGKVERVTGRLLESDTIRVLRGGALRLVSPGGRGVRQLGGGELLVRLFLSGGETYVRSSGKAPSFGWVTLSASSEGRLWGPIRPPLTEGSVKAARVRDSVQAILSRMNGVLSSLFRFFNLQERKNRLAPQWQLHESGDSLLCTLVGGSPENEYPQSTLYLSKDLEIALLGTDLEVVQIPGGIEIRPK